MELPELTPEQKLKARQCKTAEEFIELAKSEGFELSNLSDEQIEGIAGGSSWDSWYNTDLCDADCL